MTEHSAIAKNAAIHGFQYLRRLLGIAGALGVPVAGQAHTVLSEIVGEINELRRKRETARLFNLVKAIEHRVGKLEESHAETNHDRVELFVEFLVQATRDEDERKVEAYASFMQLVLQGKQQPPILRALGQAMRSLTYDELHAFVLCVRQQDWKPMLGELDEGVFWSRLAAQGLTQSGGVRFEGGATSLGRLLDRIWPQ